MAFEPRWPETPGSIHEGGELGTRWCMRMARLRHPTDCCVRGGRWRGGDGAAGDKLAWNSSESATDGAVLPILHLNGYKIANRRFWHAFSCGARRLIRLRIRTVHVRAMIRRRCISRAAAVFDTMLDRIARFRRRRGQKKRSEKTGAAGVADADYAHAEGMDRARSCGRQAGGGYVARAPGAACGDL